eukprot:COSAG01_NODE_319_length_18909_cov_32.636151_11_plen_78_part_00
MIVKAQLHAECAALPRARQPLELRCAGFRATEESEAWDEFTLSVTQGSVTLLHGAEARYELWPHRTCFRISEAKEVE